MPNVSQEWKLMMHQWVEERSMVAETSMLLKVKNMLSNFTGATGRWDLESMKIIVTNIVSELLTSMKHQAGLALMAD